MRVHTGWSGEERGFHVKHLVTVTFVADSVTEDFDPDAVVDELADQLGGVFRVDLEDDTIVNITDLTLTGSVPVE